MTSDAYHFAGPLFRSISAINKGCAVLFTFKTFCEFEKNQRLFWLKHLFFFYVKLSLLAVVIYINRTRTLLSIIPPSSSYSKAVILPCYMR